MVWFATLGDVSLRVETFGGRFGFTRGQHLSPATLDREHLATQDCAQAGAWVSAKKTERAKATFVGFWRFHEPYFSKFRSLTR